jgi:hypothetical protein
MFPNVPKFLYYSYFVLFKDFGYLDRGLLTKKSFDFDSYQLINLQVYLRFAVKRLYLS